jgi:transposase InsO family protein
MIERSYALPVKRQAQAVGFSRRVLSWRLSITLETDFCVEAIEEALMRFGNPDIFKTDQGSQFTSIAFTSVLLREKIAISMDGKGAWRHNVIIERLWRSVKYEEVYLHAYAHSPRLTEGRPIRFTSTHSFSQWHNQPAGIPLINRAGLFKQTEPTL